MRGWDPNGIAARLELALDAFRKAKVEVDSQWDDEARRGFDDDFVVPMEPKLRRSLEAIRHLADMLQKAERDCS